LYFPAPASFTGEDVLELQGHGGPVVMDMVLEAVLDVGARPARPGEFSERAFLNGRMDLSQAEAVADLIDSGSRAAARSALRSLDGVFSDRVRELSDALTETRALIEACIDFPEEEIDFLSDPQLEARLAALREKLTATRAGATRGVRRPAQRREVEPPESPGRSGLRHRHRRAGDDPGRAARAHPAGRAAPARDGHRRDPRAS
jgi:tRNA modification GTPase